MISCGRHMATQVQAPILHSAQRQHVGHQKKCFRIRSISSSILCMSLHKARCVTVCEYSAQHHWPNLICLVAALQISWSLQSLDGDSQRETSTECFRETKSEPIGLAWHATRRQRGVHREKVVTGGVVRFNGAFCALQFRMHSKSARGSELPALLHSRCMCSGLKWFAMVWKRLYTSGEGIWAYRSSGCCFSYPTSPVLSLTTVQRGQNRSQEMKWQESDLNHRLVHRAYQCSSFWPLLDLRWHLLILYHPGTSGAMTAFNRFTVGYASGQTSSVWSHAINNQKERATLLPSAAPFLLTVFTCFYALLFVLCLQRSCRHE